MSLLPNTVTQSQPDAEDGGVPEAERVPSVERLHVQSVYNAVAKQWHGTRYRAWSGVEDFVRRHVTTGSLVADVGCGNGKNLSLVESLGGVGVGCDFSAGLLEICAEQRDQEVFAGDAVCLPLRSKSFDVALNIAVIHHISSEPRRRKLISETMRLLKCNGVALFYAWALEQADGGISGHHFASQDVLVPFHKQGKSVSDGTGSDEEPKVYQRYCHVYKKGELEALFDHTESWVSVNRVYFDRGNWCVEVKRFA